MRGEEWDLTPAMPRKLGQGGAVMLRGESELRTNPAEAPGEHGPGVPCLPRVMELPARPGAETEQEL